MRFSASSHILGQALGTSPRLGDQRLLTARPWVHRRLPGELGWYLNHRLTDQHRHRIQVTRIGLKPEPLRLERQAAAAGERVVEGGQLVRVEQLRGARVFLVRRTCGTPAFPDLVPRLSKDRFVRGVLPLDQFFDESEQPLALLLLRLRGWEPVRMRRRIVHHLREDHRPRRRQRPARPPQMQRARVPVADRLLPRTGLVNGLQR
jgi:hypothetical protein